MSAEPRQIVRRMLHRNGVVAVEENFSGQKLHGRRRTWHRNGQLATEEFYRNGLLHGICHQWNETGRLLGTFRMQNGTGVQKSWHDNGRLNQQFTTIEGEFCGRSRLWLRDGTLISDRLVLFGQNVSPDEYRKAAAKDPRLPKLRGRIGKTPVRGRAMEKRKHGLFVSRLLSKHNRMEAGKWLSKEAGDKTARSLGRFKAVKTARKFVEELYQAGAVKVIVPDIYQNTHGDQFTDYLLVQLPKAKTQRTAIRKAIESLPSRKLGAVEPATDIGEGYLVLSMA